MTNKARKDYGNPGEPAKSPNRSGHKELNGTKRRAAGRDTGSRPGEEAIRDAGVVHDEQGGAVDATGGTAGSPREARGSMRDKAEAGGAFGSREGGDSTGGELAGGGGGGGLPSEAMMETGASTKRARKRKA